MIRSRLLLTILLLPIPVLPARASIDIVTIEFKPEQRAEVRAIVDATEGVCAEAFHTDFADADDGASLELHMQFRDYERVDKELNDGRFRTNWAFANARAMQAHVVLQPPIPFEMLLEAGLPVQTRIQIAHEATHLCIYRAFGNNASHPGWLAEGLAVHLASEAVRRARAMGPIESEPWTSQEIVVIRRLFADHPDYTIGSILSDEDKDIGSGRLYSVRGAFIGWLIEIGAFDEMIGEAKRLGGGSGYANALNAATLDAIRNAGVNDPDAAFKDWINAFEPRWEEEYRSLQTRGDVWVQAAFDSSNSVCWNHETLGDRDWELSGSLRIFDGDKTQMNVLLGKSDSGYISVALGPSFGITVFHRQYTQDHKSKWVRLENKEIRSLEMGRWADFKISKRHDRLLIKINRERPVMIDVKDIDLSGEWGLGCQNKSAGMWKDVKLVR